MSSPSEREPDESRGVAETGQEERAVRATELCRKACEDSGLEVAAWHKFDGWNEYMDGRIEESQLNDKARDEMEQFSRSFGKYVVIDRKEEARHQQEEKEKKERARRAAKIYKQVCAEAGMKVCFFHDFLSWSDFVEGKLTEEEFYARAKLEAEKISVQAQNPAA